MRVAAFADLVGPDGVEIQDHDDPEPGPGEAVVDVEACAINRHDLWILEGDSAMVSGEDLPFVTGLDVAGVVASVGEGVSSVEPGDRVVLCPNETCGTCEFCREGPENLCERFSLFHGGLAERACVRADRLVALPDGVDATAAAAIPTAYMTAWHMIRRADVSPGDRVLVLGATGGVGVACVQLLDTMGVHSVGTSTSPEKLDRLAELGCDEPVEAGGPEAVRESVETVDAVLNHLAGEYTEAGLRVLRRAGRMVVCGRTAGGESTFDVARLFLSHHRIVGSTMGTQADLERLVDLVAEGAFDPVVGEEYPLDETAQAFADMQSRDLFGKSVVRP
ncbi:alcohol dehydrogenase catalytic domain-containing protein [Halomarina litorea]|uniref:alcohol dehydrogenase catalytic domain-containing protein n=1 Tax=Halomarina litorea TaxID=2961595 RepID=UPI0020C36A3A|nr:alcohol dehydrogenase catalytic domain-containing protein [Halomarina sp. BCD28]